MNIKIFNNSLTVLQFHSLWTLKKNFFVFDFQRLYLSFNFYRNWDTFCKTHSDMHFTPWRIFSQTECNLLCNLKIKECNNPLHIPPSCICRFCFTRTLCFRLFATCLIINNYSHPSVNRKTKYNGLTGLLRFVNNVRLRKSYYK